MLSAAPVALIALVIMFAARPAATLRQEPPQLGWPDWSEPDGARTDHPFERG